jgi:hypothetical protein
MNINYWTNASYTSATNDLGLSPPMSRVTSLSPLATMFATLIYLPCDLVNRK